MRVILQRVIKGEVHIDNKLHGKCGNGYVILVGFTHNDNKDIADKMVKKIIELRVFEDENNKMNKSIIDINGEILSISQFTLYADTSGGRRPSFTNALNKDEASNLYDYFNEKLSEYVHTETGIFGSDMKVNILNDGPVTIHLDSVDL